MNPSTLPPSAPEQDRTSQAPRQSHTGFWVWFVAPLLTVFGFYLASEHQAALRGQELVASLAGQNLAGRVSIVELPSRGIKQGRAPTRAVEVEGIAGRRLLCSLDRPGKAWMVEQRSDSLSGVPDMTLLAQSPDVVRVCEEMRGLVR